MLNSYLVNLVCLPFAILCILVPANAAPATYPVSITGCGLKGYAMAAAINFFDTHAFGGSSVDVRCAGSCTTVEINGANYLACSSQY